LPALKIAPALAAEVMIIAGGAQANNASKYPVWRLQVDYLAPAGHDVIRHHDGTRRACGKQQLDLTQRHPFKRCRVLARTRKQQEPDHPSRIGTDDGSTFFAVSPGG
jgi:hypothetical protein